jgi:putative ABC transport system ATP-binding protein
LVSLRQVSKSYTTGKQQIPVLRSITLDVWRGESVAVVGPSGAGKSTLLHVLALLTPVDTGEVWMGGRLLGPDDWWNTARRRQIGMVFQDGKLLSNLNVIDNVCVPLVHRGLWPTHQRQRAADALRLVGLDHRLRHYPNQLSGGELARVAIARALVTEPQLILADEPTGTLDSANGEQVARLLFELVTSERSLVLVTHQAPLAAQARRIITLKDGCIDHG